MAVNYWNDYLRELPFSIQIESNNYHKWQDKHSYVIGKLILLKGLEIMGGSSDELNNIEYGKYGKPYIRNGIDFNISHSGGYVVCALGRDVNIGIDVELIAKVNLSEYIDVMSEKQWKEINTSSNPIHSFFRYWTIKESIMKADGRGFGMNPKNISIGIDSGCYNNIMWFFKDFYISEEVCTSLATNLTKVSLIIKRVEIQNGILELC